MPNTFTSLSAKAGVRRGTAVMRRLRSCRTPRMRYASDRGYQAFPHSKVTSRPRPRCDPHHGGAYSCLRESGGGAGGGAGAGARTVRLFQLQAESLGESGQVGAPDVVTAVDVLDQISRHGAVGDLVGSMPVFRWRTVDQWRQFRRNAGQ